MIARWCGGAWSDRGPADRVAPCSSVLSRTPSTSRRLLALTIAVAACLPLLWGAAPARAGTYEVWSCRTFDGGPLPATGWVQTTRHATADDVVLADGCAGGGSLVTSLRPARGFATPVRVAATFRAPPGTRIVGYRLLRYLFAAPDVPPASYGYVAGVREITATADLDWDCASDATVATLACSQLGSPSAVHDPGNVVERDGVALDALELFAACAAAPCGDPNGSTARTLLHRARIELEDERPPAAPLLSGSLVSDGTVSGPATVVVASSDVGGGVAAMTLAIDGVPEQVARFPGPDGACAEPYTRPQPCATTAAHAFAVDPAGLAEGAHVASGTVIDAAGNVTSWGPVPFQVVRPQGGGGPGGGSGDPAGPSNGSPAVASPRLRLAGPRVVHQRGRRPVRLAGTLQARDGTPIAGATLHATARPLGVLTPRVRRLGSVTTGRDGRFSLAVRVTGVERVELAFSPTPGAAATAVAAATVRERSRLTIARSRARLRRHGRLTLSGRLLGAGAAARGAVVEVQAIVSGRWRTVGTVTAARTGRWRWRYRFTRVTRDTIFTFRAVVQRHPGWPLPTQRSRPIRVRVDGA